MKYQVDVVIPTYNRLWALSRVVRFYLDHEGVQRVIVVDDGSTDGTEVWLRKMSEREPRLLTLRHERNRGASASRNTGANVTQAPLVFFADDDMLLSPVTGLSLMVQEMEAQSADIAAPVYIFSETQIFSTLSPVTLFISGPPPLLYNQRTLELRSQRVLASCVFPSSFVTPLACGMMLMRRKVLEYVRYDEELGVTSYRDETDFQLKALMKGFRLIACARPVLIDLARHVDKGGCHSVSYAEYEWKACCNNWKILERHKNVIQKKIGIFTPVIYLQCCFLVEHAVNRFARFYLGRLFRNCGIKRKGQ